jgi:hypothetical protein
MSAAMLPNRSPAAGNHHAERMAAKTSLISTCETVSHRGGLSALIVSHPRA